MSLKEAYLEVVDLPGREVAAAIEQVMIAVTRNILGGDGFGYSLPCAQSRRFDSRHAAYTRGSVPWHTCDEA
jgi:hypothetical protein